MLSVHSNVHEKRSFLNWASLENPGFWSVSFCVAEDEYQPIVRDSPVSVGAVNGEAICSLCADFQNDTVVHEDDTISNSADIHYTRFSELDDLSRRGCFTCDTFRSAVLYHHPSTDSYRLLMHDDYSIKISPRERDGKLTGVTISYPYKHSMEEFTNYDPEWPLGRPEPEMEGILSLLDGPGPRKRYKRLSTATVDVSLRPKRSMPSIPQPEEDEGQRSFTGQFNRFSSSASEHWYRDLCKKLSEELEPWLFIGDNEQVQIARKENAEVLRGLDNEQNVGFLKNGSMIPMRDSISPKGDHLAALSRLLGWLYECLSTHVDCGLSKSKPLTPKRVLDVGSSDSHELRLHEPDGVPIVYACLSYRWGESSENRCQLLKRNLEQFQNGTNLPDLPSTIKDAVQIAKSLGIRYLWVDALCIIQDDLLDWREQSPLMGDIYGNALMTIAATSSEHADCGLFDTRVAECYTCEPCVLFERELIRPLPQMQRYFDGGPLFQRAWTTQELYLSRRILHATDAFLAWECRELHCTEYFPHGFPSRANPTEAARGIFPSFFAKELFRSENAPAGVAYEAWQDLVRDYSSKSMTKEEDVLVAVAGLAASIGRTTDDTYLAGLWEGNLLRDLLWQTDESRVRPKLYTAPTWSWASTQHSSSQNMRKTRQRSIDFLSIKDTAIPVVHIDAVQVTYLDNNPQSQVLSGKLQLTGKIAKLEFFLENVWASSAGDDLYVRAPDFNAVGDPLFDTADMVKSNRRHAVYRYRTTNNQLYCLAITSEEAQPDYEDKHWIAPELDHELRDPQKAGKRFDQQSRFHLEKKKRRSYDRSSRRRFSMSDFSDPDLELWDTSLVDYSRLRPYEHYFSQPNIDTRVEEVLNEDGKPVYEDEDEDEDNETGKPNDNLETHAPQISEQGYDTDKHCPKIAASDTGNTIPHDEHKDNAITEAASIDIPQESLKVSTANNDLWEMSKQFVGDMEARYEDMLQAEKDKQQAYDAASITSSARPMRDWGHAPMRTTSLDRNGFRRWSKRFKNVHSPPSNAAERAEERRKELRDYVQGLMLEKIEDDGIGDENGQAVYRRVGVAKLEIRGGETEAFEGVQDVTVVII